MEATRGGSRRVTLVALLCTVLLLGGCAAGSPAVVAPAPDLPAALPPATANAAPEMAQAPVATSPPGEPAVATSQSGSQPVATAPAPRAAPATAAPAKAVEAAAFAQDVPVVSDDPAVSEPAPGVPSSAPVPGGAAPPAQAEPTARPAAPPDPGTGQSEIVEGGSNGRAEVALTFDAGADTGDAAAILDLLRDQGIHATFGMTGLWAQANPDLVRRMVAEGHQLINHTWDHPSLTGANTGLPPQTPEQVAQELGDAEAVVRDLTGYEMRPYFRPPYGDYDATSLGYTYDNGYYFSVMWTCDSHGWDGWGAQAIIDYCTANIKEDEIILLHLGSAAPGDFEALPGLIRFFRDNGYAFVTVEQMLQP